MNGERSTPVLLLLVTIWLTVVAVVIGAPTAAPEDQCLNEATYNPTSGKCECNGGLSGDGDLCCYDDSAYRLCEVRGDPRFYSGYNVKTFIDIPCPQSLSVSESQEGSKTCRLQTFFNNKYVVESNIYPDRFTLSISVDSGTKKYIQIFGQKFWHPIKNEMIHQDDLVDVSNSKISIDGVPFHLSFDDTKNMWTVKGCGTIVNFRKYKSSRYNQPLVPGLCLQSLRTNTYLPVEEGNLCGLKNTYEPDPYDVLEHKLLANVLGQQPVLEGQEDIGSQDVKAQCVAASSSLRLCSGPFKERMAIERCAGFILHPTIRVCMVSAGLTEVEILQWFSTCLTASCANHKPSCDQMRTSYVVEKCNRRVYLKCPGWGSG